MITKYKLFEKLSELFIFQMYSNPSLTKLKNYLKDGGDINIMTEHDETLLILLSEKLSKMSLSESREIRKIISYLIDVGADLDIISGYYKNLFNNLILYTTDLKLIKKTIDAGADVNKISNHNNPLETCIINIDVIEKDFEKAKLIIESSTFKLWTSDTWNYLYQAINNERYDIIEVLLENGAEIDKKFMYIIKFNTERLEVVKTRFEKYYNIYMSKKKAKEFNL